MGPISAGDCLLASLVCAPRWQLTLSLGSSGACHPRPRPTRPGTARQGQRADSSPDARAEQRKMTPGSVCRRAQRMGNLPSLVSGWQEFQNCSWPQQLLDTEKISARPRTHRCTDPQQAGCRAALPPRPALGTAAGGSHRAGPQPARRGQRGWLASAAPPSRPRNGGQERAND